MLPKDIHIYNGENRFFFHMKVYSTEIVILCATFWLDLKHIAVFKYNNTVKKICTAT